MTKLLLDFLKENFNLIFTVLTLIFVLIASPKLGKKVTQKMFVIAILCFSLSVTSFVEHDLTTASEIIRKTAAVLTNVIRPTIILCFYFLITPINKRRSLLWLLVILCAFFYGSSLFTNYFYETQYNVLLVGRNFLLNNLSFGVSLLLIIWIAIRSVYLFKKTSVIENGLLLIITLFVLISSVIDYINVNHVIINDTIVIAATFYYIYIHLHFTRSYERHLMSVNRIDSLTGLGNETAYYEAVDELEQQIAAGNANFAVIVMDVNNVKITNDTYGHRYGCHLIVTVGHALPTIFPNTRLFHIGGDEFIAILEGDALNNKDVFLARFDEVLRHTVTEFEGKELTLSVARGISEHKFGLIYNDVYQKADQNMYVNKNEIKTTYPDIVVR